MPATPVDTTLTTVGYGDVYPITAFGRFWAAIISLVGIGIIAIPTGIIAAGFNHVIDNKHEIREDKQLPELDHLEEEDLLVLQAKLAKELGNYGYSVTISNEQNQTE